MNKVVYALTLIALVSAGAEFEAFLGELKVGQQCANSINTFSVTSFTVDPFPPTRGSPIVSTSVGTFNQAETITSVNINISCNGRSFAPQNEAQSGSYTAGQVGTFTYSTTLPSNAPKGSYIISGGLVNSSGAQIHCWQVSFNLN